MKTSHTSCVPSMQGFNILSDDGPIACLKYESVADYVLLVQYELAYHRYLVVVLNTILDVV